MYEVHPRNLMLGPFLTLLFTLSRNRGSPGCPAGWTLRKATRCPEAAPANAHEGALQHCVADVSDRDRDPVTLGPFMTLILTVHSKGCRRPRDSGLRRSPAAGHGRLDGTVTAEV